MKARGAQGRKKFGLARAKALAVDLISRDQARAVSGLALVMPQPQGLQAKGEEKGASKKAAYATSAQAREYLLERVEEAKSTDELIELVANARIASILADPNALSPGEMLPHHYDPSDGKVREILAEEIKAVAPRRSPKQKKLEKAA